MSVRAAPIPPFRVCGYAGIASALLVSAALTRSQSLSSLILMAISLTAISTFLFLVLATKVVTGEEQLIYYHHEVAVVAVAAVLLRLLHRPLLPYLDIAILGVGMFLGCGRIGCLLAGCCFGRPFRWGIRYRHTHAEEGFPRYLVGTPLFPIQLVEALTVFCTVIAGAALVLEGAPAGAALSCYVVMYGFARFCFEFARGDLDRSYLWSLSEAQWISTVLVVTVLWEEHKGLLPFHAWHFQIAAAQIAIAVAALRPSTPNPQSTFRL
jgi:hypothetical protein